MPDVLMSGIVINEILVDPNGAANFDTDGNGTAAAVDEYIELFNTSSNAIDISGVQLWDDGVGNWFTFPAGTILQPGGHALVLSGVQAGGALPTGGPDDLFFDAGRGSPLINNGGDNVTVYDPGSDEYIIARFNGDAFDTPTTDYPGFSATATQSGTGENFGNDIDGYSIQRSGDGADTFVNDKGPTPGTINVCLTLGSSVDTPHGPVPVEDLRAGDMLTTLDHGPQPIQWIYAQPRPLGDVLANPRMGAVRIARGALGGGLPVKSLTVSRQHRMLVRSSIAERMFGAPEVMIHAKDLIGVAGITTAPATDQVYFHILMPRHNVIFAHGAPAETLFLGGDVVSFLSETAARELATLVGITATNMIPARPFIKGPKARRLVQRHIANSRALWRVEVKAA